MASHTDVSDNAMMTNTTLVTRTASILVLIVSVGTFSVRSIAISNAPMAMKCVLHTASTNSAGAHQRQRRGIQNTGRATNAVRIVPDMTDTATIGRFQRRSPCTSY